MIKEAAGIKYRCRNGFDEGMAADILSSKVYSVADRSEETIRDLSLHAEPLSRQLLLEPSLYREGDLFIDIGAYAGIWSSLVGVSYPGSRGIAVEPLPDNIGLIQEQFALNGLTERFHTLQGAVGYGKTVDISYGGGESMWMGYEKSESTPHKLISVTVFSLYDLLIYCLEHFKSDRVFTMKIDCEGGEYGFLDSTGVSELQHMCWIVGEYHHGWERIHEKLSFAGFKVLHGIWENRALFKYFNPNWKHLWP